ncbi:MAG: DUF4091 domain-containing protein [Victivallales bacterium]|nr:DUF4091 domain-containing protein [Victivallales bacterium]
MKFDSPQSMLCSSLVKVMPQEKPTPMATPSATALRGERFSFQVAYYIAQTVDFPDYTVSSKLPFRVSSVELVPVNWMPDAIDDEIVSDRLGFYPDLLRPIPPKGKLTRATGQWRSIWISVDIPSDCNAGSYDFEINLGFNDVTPAGTTHHSHRHVFTLNVIDAVLPHQSLKVTNWFHTDCLIDYYGLEVFSDEYWRTVGNFMRCAAQNGINMILTPLFTPPLDTVVGGERTTVQLVGVKRSNGKYTFDFSRLDKWLKLARECGIEYFEMSHLFTQWGAEHAPKIIADVEGETKRIFGWETDATGDEYVAFMEAFLPELTQFIEAQGLKDRVYFHCSDEPSEKHITTYEKDSKLLRRLLPGFKIFDALSHTEYYEKGLVTIPVPSETVLDKFMPLNPPERWTYYCCGPTTTYVNRFIFMTSSRNRVLGALLYNYGIDGFLHWGFNFYNSQCSISRINPYHETSSIYSFPAGDPFVVYPGEGGVPEFSLRLVVFNEGLQDMRALQLLESLQGREKTIELLTKANGGKPMKMASYPKGEAAILSLRETVNAAIQSAIHANPKSK